MKNSELLVGDRVCCISIGYTTLQEKELCINETGTVIISSTIGSIGLNLTIA